MLLTSLDRPNFSTPETKAANYKMPANITCQTFIDKLLIESLVSNADQT